MIIKNDALIYYKHAKEKFTKLKLIKNNNK